MMKQVRIFVSRRITLERAEKDPVTMLPGANVVDADVAEHPFVKAHTVEGATDAANLADAELQAKVAELLARAEAAEAKVAELQAMVDAFTATEPAKGKK